MRLRIAISAGLAAVVVLSVFTMIRLDSRVAADGFEIDAPISTGEVTAVEESSVQQDLIIDMENSQQDESNDFVMSELVETDNATTVQIGEPQPETIYVYPDGSIAPTPSDFLSGSYGTAGYEFDDWDDDHEEYDDDHDEEWEHDDDRSIYLEKLAGGLFVERDQEDDHHDDDHDDDRDHDDDDDDDHHDRDHDDD